MIDSPARLNPWSLSVFTKFSSFMCCLSLSSDWSFSYLTRLHLRTLCCHADDSRSLIPHFSREYLCPFSPGFTISVISALASAGVVIYPSGVFNISIILHKVSSVSSNHLWLHSCVAMSSCDKELVWIAHSFCVSIDLALKSRTTDSHNKETCDPCLRLNERLKRVKLDYQLAKQK